ncbi:hypothetical protein MTsPCn3_09220 [Erythrobacter sp. MTPC3]
MMITLKQAREAEKLEQFIAEHKSEIGDEATFNLTLQAMAGTLKEAPETSSQDDCDD